MCSSDLLVWFGLRDRLTPEEERELKWELQLMTEAEVFMDTLQSKQF